jgi:hypothetical protein
MRNTYLLVLLLLVGKTAVAQPVIDKLFDFQPGDEYVFRKLAAGQALDTSMFPSRGTNLSWNMSTLNLDTTLSRDPVLAPASSDFPSSFPTATYVFKEHSGLQQYYRKRADTIMYLGSNYNNMPTVYNPGGITVLLPATYAASGYNNFAPATTTIPGGAVWTYYGRYNASGTLQLPGGNSFQNVGLYVISGGDASIRFTDYMWAVPGRKDPLVRIQFRHQGGSTTVEHMYVSTNALAPAGIGQSQMSEPQQLSVYPNPAAEQLFIDNDKPLTAVKVYNMQGSLVFTGSHRTIATGHLPACNYIIVAAFKDATTAVARFVVQH